MGQKLIVGRYIPIDSFIHRLDSRAKLLATILYLIVLFFANNWMTYLVLTLFVGLGIYFSGISFSYFLRGVRPMIWLITFTALLQILFTPGSTMYFQYGFFYISKEGILSGLFIFLRFVLIIFISTLLTLSTEALDLTDAIEFFLKPLKIFKFPIHEMTLMLALALRFIPTMVDEAEVIMNAQRARGVSFNEGPIMQRLKNLVPLLIPLFISSYDRAPQLATAMEARGYQGGEKRTKYRELTWKKTDTAVLLSFLVLFSAVYMLRV